MTKKRSIKKTQQPQQEGVPPGGKKSAVNVTEKPNENAEKNLNTEKPNVQTIRELRTQNNDTDKVNCQLYYIY